MSPTRFLLRQNAISIGFVAVPIMVARMTRRALLTIVALLGVYLGFLPSTCGAAEKPTTNQTTHCLWRVKGKTHTMFLAGTIHTLREDNYPLPKPIEDAYARSSKVVFEVDEEEMKSPSVHQKLSEAARLPQGVTLQECISKKTQEDLDAYCKKTGISPTTFHRTQPWAVSLAISLIELQSLGFDPELGMEKHFFTLAKRDGKKLAALETIDFQISLFTNFTAKESEESIKETLERVATFKKLSEDMLTAWKSGDLPALDKLLIDTMRRFPEVYEKLVVDRNKRWISQLEEMLNGREDVFVAVGAGHLGGKHGLLELLRKKGFVVEQL